MKVLVTITIILLFLLNPFTVHAQLPSCNNAGSFVDWKKCLEGTTVKGTNPITTPVFINSAYKEIYDNARQGCSLVSVMAGGNGVVNPNTNNCDSIASTVVLNAFALDIFALVLAVMFMVFNFLIFRSRIMYVTAGDNEEAVKKAKKIATAALIGFVFVFVGLIIGEILAISIGSNIWEIKLFG